MIQTDRFRVFYPRVENLEEIIEHFLADLARLYPDARNGAFNIDVKAKPAFMVSIPGGSSRDPGKYAVTLTARRTVTRR